MAVRTHPQTGLAIIFVREGQEIARRFAPDGSAAARMPIIMIAEFGALQPGDRLMIEPDDDRLVEILGPWHSGP
jgi:hypothetical protein